MLVDEQFRKCVAFLYVDKRDEVSGEINRIPAATTFFVSVPIENEGDITYAVTARHSIDASRPFGPLYVRVNPQQGVPTDFIAPQDQWIQHPEADVAVIRVGLQGGPWDIITIPQNMFADDEFVAKHGVAVGDDLLFVGLFTEFAGRERNQPIVRFGNIALMPHEKIPLKIDPDPLSDERVLLDVYLAEARSWGGHSGSPAFIYFPPDRTPGSIRIGGGPLFALLGLVHGHYEIKRDVKFIGDILGSGNVPINAGIAVIIPAQKIIDLLNTEELVKEREAILKARQKNKPVPQSDTVISQENFTKKGDRGSSL